jgi:hypothetical protein
MVNREMIKQEVDRLRDDQLERVAEFIAFIKFCETNSSNNWQPLIDSLSLFSQDFMTSR